MMVSEEKVILRELGKKCNFKCNGMDCQGEEGSQKIRIKRGGKSWIDGTCLDGINDAIFREQGRKVRLPWVGDKKETSLCSIPGEDHPTVC